MPWFRLPSEVPVSIKFGEQETPAEDKPPADKTSDSVVNALLAGVTGLVTALTALGSASGQLGRMLREHGIAAGISIVLVLVGFTLALVALIGSKDKTNSRLIKSALFSSIALGIGLLFLLLTIHQGDRPSITLKVTPLADTAGLVAVDLSAQSSGVTAKGSLVLAVVGRPKNGGGLVRMFYGKTGPTAEGQLSTSATLILDTTKYNQVRVYASSYRTEAEGLVVDCDGMVLDPMTNVPAAQPSNFSPPLAACVNADITQVLAPAASSNPAASTKP
jgi:uncharacterized membrane protein